MENNTPRIPTATELYFQQKIKPAFDNSISQEIERLRQYEKIKVLNTNDQENYAVIKNAHIAAKNLKGEIEKTRKEVKSVPLEVCAQIDEYAKKLTADVFNLIQYFDSQRKVVEAAEAEEKQRKKAAAEEKKNRLDKRIKDCILHRIVLESAQIEAYTDDEWESLLRENPIPEIKAKVEPVSAPTPTAYTADRESNPSPAVNHKHLTLNQQTQEINANGSSTGVVLGRKIYDGKGNLLGTLTLQK